MKNAAMIRSFRAGRICRLLLALSIGCWECLSVWGQTTNQSAAATGTTHSVFLEYKEAQHGIVPWAFAVTPQTKPFAKEPQLGGHRVFRGTFAQPAPGGGHAMGFVWDHSAGKLYLDVNGNGDLTDDAGQPFPCSAKTRTRAEFQSFTNIHLALKGPGGLPYPALVDIELYTSGNLPQGSVSCRSFWEGRLALGGRDWQVGRIDTSGLNTGGSNGSLLWRPWAAREEPLSAQTASVEVLPLTPTLFAGGQAYQVECAYVQQQGKAGYRLDLREKQVELGELKVPGKYIERVVLNSHARGKPPITVVLDAPQPTMRIPVGNYDHLKVQLRSGNIRAFRNVQVTPNAGTVLSLSADKASVLLAGGPLTNSVSAHRQGRNLALSYELLGADHAVYQLSRSGTQLAAPPQFVIYKQGKAIHSGNFEFG